MLDSIYQLKLFITFWNSYFHFEMLNDKYSYGLRIFSVYDFQQSEDWNYKSLDNLIGQNIFQGVTLQLFIQNDTTAFNEILGQLLGGGVQTHSSMFKFMYIVYTLCL